MLSRAEVETEIARGDIVIEYASGLGDSAVAPVEHRVDPAHKEDNAYKSFDEAFFGNRLSVTLGPLVYSHRYRRKSGRQGYKNFPRVSDLRGSEGMISVQPGESIAVNTAERVTLGPSIGALTFPRLSHATAGLVLSPSYIDPLWTGLLVLEIANLGHRPFVLRVGEKVAAVHFYRVEDTELTNLDRDAFSKKSHHFGLAWSSLLSSDRDPFPLRRRAEGDAPDFKLLDRMRGVWKQLVALGVSAVVVVSAVVWGGGIVGQLQNLGTVSERVTKEAEARQELAEDLEALANVAGYSGQARITLAPNEQEATVTLPSPTPAGILPRVVLVGAGLREGVNVQAEVSSASAQTSTVTLRLTDSSISGESRSYVVDFVVFP